MGATKYWLYFAFLVIFLSLKGVNTSKTNAGIKTKIPKQYPDGDTVTVLEKIKSDVNWIEKTLESLLEYKSSKATASKLLYNCRLFHLVNEMNDHVLVPIVNG